MVTNFAREFGPPTLTADMQVFQVPYLKSIRNADLIYYYRDDGKTLRECFITAGSEARTMDRMRAKGFIPIGAQSTPEELERLYQRLEERRPAILADLQEQMDRLDEYMQHPMPADEWRLSNRIRSGLQGVFHKVKHERLTRADFKKISDGMRQGALARRNQLAALLRGISMGDMQFLIQSAIAGMDLELTPRAQTPPPVVEEEVELDLTPDDDRELQEKRKAWGKKMVEARKAKAAVKVND